MYTTAQTQGRRTYLTIVPNAQEAESNSRAEANPHGYQSFAEEMLLHLDTLHRCAVRLTGTLQDAEDLVQETVARALACHAQFRPGTNLRAWLCTIQRSLFLDGYRRRRRAPLLHSLDLLEEEGTLYETTGARASVSAEQVAMHGLIDDAVVTALRDLPECFRLAVLLCDVYDLSYAQAAQTMGCALGTVMSRLHRGRALLRNALSPQYGTQRAPMTQPAAMAA
jgi:RNA polymerase sigma-70 factor (ECF subfamily)